MLIFGLIMVQIVQLGLELVKLSYGGPTLPVIVDYLKPVILMVTYVIKLSFKYLPTFLAQRHHFYSTTYLKLR